MPNTKDRLKIRFMVGDGRDEAEKIIIQGNGKISRGVISYGGDSRIVLEAIQYLVEEWDYDFIVDYEHRAIVKFLKRWTSLSLSEMLMILFIAAAGAWFIGWAVYLWARQ